MDTLCNIFEDAGIFTFKRHTNIFVGVCLCIAESWGVTVRPYVRAYASHTNGRVPIRNPPGKKYSMS